MTVLGQLKPAAAKTATHLAAFTSVAALFTPSCSKTMASRITKSSIDWAKFASVVPKSNQKNFTAFKARSEAYLTR